MVIAIVSTFAMIFTENVTFAGIKAALIPILYAGVLSGGIAYTLQMVGQKYAQPSVASIVMSLESVFAALAGWIILGEVLIFPMMILRNIRVIILMYMLMIISRILQVQRLKMNAI